MRRVLNALVPRLAAPALDNCAGGGWSQTATTLSQSFGGPARDQTTADAALVEVAVA